MGKDCRQVWYFTFCLDDVPEKRDHYVKFYGTREEARDKMFAKYGEHWAFQYDAEQILDQIKRLGIREYKE